MITNMTSANALTFAETIKMSGGKIKLTVTHTVPLEFPEATLLRVGIASRILLLTSKL